MKDRLSEITWGRFLDALRLQFYPVTIRQQKESKFLVLNMTGSITMKQYANKFIELSQFVPKYVASEMLRIRKFKEDLII